MTSPSDLTPETRLCYRVDTGNRRSCERPVNLKNVNQKKDKNMQENKIKLGDKVKDLVTGFTGVVVSRIEYINGCVQFGIVPKADKDKMHDCQYVDWQRLQSVGTAISLPSQETGGPQFDAPKSCR